MKFKKGEKICLGSNKNYTVIEILKKNIMVMLFNKNNTVYKKLNS